MRTIVARTLLALAAIAVTTATPASSAAQIRVSVIADPPGRDEDNLNGEVLTVTNRLTVPVDLSGWSLCDAVAHCYTFPEGPRIGPSASLRVHTGQGRDTLTDLYMGRSEPLWDDWADIATLRDTDGVIRARCVWDRGRGLDCRRTAQRILAGEAGAGAGSGDGLGEATSPAAAGSSDTSSGRPGATAWCLSPMRASSIATCQSLRILEVRDHDAFPTMVDQGVFAALRGEGCLGERPNVGFLLHRDRGRLL